jgi:hypothetical protein
MLSSIRAGFQAEMRAEGYNEIAIAKNELVLFDTAISTLTFLLTYSHAPAIHALTHLQILQTLESQSSLSRTSKQLDFMKCMTMQGLMALSLTLLDSAAPHNPLIRIGLNATAIILNNPLIMEKLISNQLVQKMFSSSNTSGLTTAFSAGSAALDYFYPNPTRKRIQRALQLTTQVTDCAYQMSNQFGLNRRNLLEKCSRIATETLSFYASYSLGSMIETVAPTIGGFVYAIEPNKSFFCRAIKTTTCLALNFLTGSFLAGTVAATTTEKFFSLS